MGRSTAVLEPAELRLPKPAPTLESGDHLTRAEFERRYAIMPEDMKAELIEGVVYVSSPVRIDVHGEQTLRVSTWIGVYATYTPGVQGGQNSTVRLDQDNEPQPDLSLRIRSKSGGQSRTVDGYVEGAPEFVAEVAASTVSMDLHEKMRAYRRNGVREYVVWRVENGELDYFVWREGRYERLSPDDAGIYRSEVFPGLWLDAPALLRGDMARVLQVLQEGLATPEHQQFVERLGQHGSSPDAQ